MGSSHGTIARVWGFGARHGAVHWASAPEKRSRVIACARQGESSSSSSLQ